MNEDLDVLKCPCRYCKRDVMPPMNIPHADDCPSNTGIFPVDEQDIHPYGMRCSACHRVLELGDRYTHRTLVPQTGEDLAGASVVEPVCIECGFSELSAEREGTE